MVFVLAGCGRVGFDSSARDATIDVPTIDAAPVCSPAPCTITDSMTDWSMTQGDHGWTYGYWWIDQDADQTYQPSDFIAMTFNTNVWDPPDYNPDPASPQFTWCYLAQWGAHPGWSPQRKDPVRRWTSTVEGAATLTAYHAKSDTSGGNGTRAILLVDGVEVWRHDVAGTDGVGVTTDVPALLHVGSVVDYILDPIGDDAIDTTNMGLTIGAR